MSTKKLKIGENKRQKTEKECEKTTFKIMCLITTALIIRTLEVALLGIGNGLETT